MQKGTQAITLATHKGQFLVVELGVFGIAQHIVGIRNGLVLAFPYPVYNGAYVAAQVVVLRYEVACFRSIIITKLLPQLVYKTITQVLSIKVRCSHTSIHAIHGVAIAANGAELFALVHLACGVNV